MSATSMHEPERASGAEPSSNEGRLFMWFPDQQSQAKVVHYLTRNSFRFHLAEGACVIVEAAWGRTRELVLPLRRLLTQFESDDLRVLYKADGGELTTVDFPRVHSFAQFALVSGSAWLHEMLDGKRLAVAFQPIVMASDATKIFAQEALLRGIGPNDAVVFPGYILDVARSCGMLAQVDRAARDIALDALVQGRIAERVFVNISAGTAHDPAEAVDMTARLIDKAGIARERVVFEVTESDRTLDMDMLRRILAAHRKAGFGVALDDVGAGYSSLNLLHQLRPDYIKLDMALIHGVHKDNYKALIAQKIIEIAQSLGIRTIAEGIESGDELAWVQGSGAEFAQGYFIGRPSAPEFAPAA